jgi:hypothetical protein
MCGGTTYVNNRGMKRTQRLRQRPYDTPCGMPSEEMSRRKATMHVGPCQEKDRHFRPLTNCICRPPFVIAPSVRLRETVQHVNPEA